ncbi:MAG: cold shock domain-containing protein [Bacteroidales bacterium]|nr:cold shock domain-containing protein [Bacteroidales bacterium]
MAKSQESFNKKEIRNKKEKKRQDKMAKKIAKKDQEKGNLDNMIAYVDEFGRISDTPPDPSAKKAKTKASDIEVSVPRSENVPKSNTRTGRVTFFNDSKGYGFIKDSMSGENVFVHINNTLDDIVEGNTVTYEITKGPKGLTATQVKKA